MLLLTCICQIMSGICVMQRFSCQRHRRIFNVDSSLSYDVVLFIVRRSHENIVLCKSKAIKHIHDPISLLRGNERVYSLRARSKTDIMCVKAKIVFFWVTNWSFFFFEGLDEHAKRSQYNNNWCFDFVINTIKPVFDHSDRSIRRRRVSLRSIVGRTVNAI